MSKCVFVLICKYTNALMCVCVYVLMHVCSCVLMYLCAYVLMYVTMHVLMCEYVNLHFILLAKIIDLKSLILNSLFVAADPNVTVNHNCII